MSRELTPLLVAAKTVLVILQVALLDPRRTGARTWYYTGCSSSVIPCNFVRSSSLAAERYGVRNHLIFISLIHRLSGLAWYENIPRWSLLSISVYKRYFMFLVV